MKKIININLSGRIIPIEDSAYEKLQSYIESLRRYFAHEEGRDEIINDIESRIAELMSEKIRLGSAGITDADINEIIASMGRPEDFEAAEEGTTASAGASSSSQQSSANTDYKYTTGRKNRLYRDTSDKMLGGVCAGLASYINIDPAIVRLLFAIITFGGFGFGIIIYILLWMILPARDLDQYDGKRLYRNPEERVLGGVASGLAAYFNKEAWLIRLLFAAPLILNIFFGILSWPFFHEGSFIPNIIFGSLTGTFILAYIVLWIVLPEAKSQYQQMEMRGEKVDVNTIRQNVKDGMENMKDKMKDWGEEVKQSAQNLSGKAKEFANTRGKTFASEVGAAAGRTGRGIGHVIGVLFKAFFLFVAGTIAFGLFVGLMGLIFGGIGVWPLKNFMLDGFWQNAFAWGTIVLFLGVPLIGFITWLLRRIMRVKRSGSYLGWTFGGLWTLGWISAALLAASLTNDFRVSNYKRPGTEIPVAQPANGRMIVKVTEPEIEYSGTIPWLDVDGKGVDITNDTLKLANVKVRVMASDDSNYHVEVKKYSRGKSITDAENRAQQLQFNVAYADSVLDIGSGIAITKESKFRAQEVIVFVKVPVGKKIRFDETLQKFHTLNIRIREHRRGSRWERDIDFGMDEYFDYDTNVDYIMGENGVPYNPDKPVPEKKKRADYRFEENDSSRIQKAIELKKQEIKDLEEKQKKRTSSLKIKGIDKEEVVASLTTPVYSVDTALF
jgi:phage shock protein PspC (stress-responsive transcriptional regulator)